MGVEKGKEMEGREEDGQGWDGMGTKVCEGEGFGWFDVNATLYGNGNGNGNGKWVLKKFWVGFGMMMMMMRSIVHKLTMVMVY